MPTTVRVHKPMDFNVIDFHFVTIYGAKSAASAPEVHLMRELAPASRLFCGLLGLVPGGGVEPPRPEGRRILSPLRLPVPPSRLYLEVLDFTAYFTLYVFVVQDKDCE